MSIYDFTVKTSQGKEKSLADYKGKVLLIVNTASKCGFTPQFEALQKLYLAYKDKGLEILGFPCNQFAAQDPGSDAEIQQFCRYNYGVTFQIFENIGMCIGLMPITGIPLPFISFGSSSMMMQCATVGIVQSVWRHRAKAS